MTATSKAISTEKKAGESHSPAFSLCKLEMELHHIISVLLYTIFLVLSTHRILFITIIMFSFIVLANIDSIF